MVPASDTTPGDWVVTGLRGFAELVALGIVPAEAIVPAGFASYIRVFHPAYRTGGDSFRPVRWAEVAAANQQTDHVGMHFDVLIGSDDLYSLPLSQAFSTRLRKWGRFLGSRSNCLCRCSLAIPPRRRRAGSPPWEGWGDIRADVASAPKFQPAPRTYHLLAGPIESASESMSEHREQSASVWWPDDHSWCVATEIDFDTTFIGCDEICRDEILRIPNVEALAVDAAARGYEAS